MAKVSNKKGIKRKAKTDDTREIEEDEEEKQNFYEGDLMNRLIIKVGKKKAEEYSKKLTCYKCKQTWKETKIGSCKNTIGTECFNNILKKRNKNQRRCPNCKQQWDGKYSPTTNLALQIVKDLILAPSKEDELEIKCEKHKQECKHFCHECKTPLGDTCLHSTIHSGHQIDSLKAQHSLHLAAINENFTRPLNRISQDIKKDKEYYEKLLSQKELNLDSILVELSVQTENFIKLQKSLLDEKKENDALNINSIFLEYEEKIDKNRQLLDKLSGVSL